MQTRGRFFLLASLCVGLVACAPKGDQSSGSSGTSYEKPETTASAEDQASSVPDDAKPAPATAVDNRPVITTLAPKSISIAEMKSLKEQGEAGLKLRIFAGVKLVAIPGVFINGKKIVPDYVDWSINLIFVTITPDMISAPGDYEIYIETETGERSPAVTLTVAE